MGKALFNPIGGRCGGIGGRGGSMKGRGGDWLAKRSIVSNEVMAVADWRSVVVDLRVKQKMGEVVMVPLPEKSMVEDIFRSAQEAIEGDSRCSDWEGGGDLIGVVSGTDW
ncbi:hypothetical protein Tco_1035033 [Tanacetum coccineum]